MPRPFRPAVIPTALCPCCGYTLDRASEPGGAAPTPGDWTVCIECAALLRFDAALRPVQPAPLELAMALADAELGPQLRRMREAVRAASKITRPPVRAIRSH